MSNPTTDVNGLLGDLQTSAIAQGTNTASPALTGTEIIVLSIGGALYQTTLSAFTTFIQTGVAKLDGTGKLTSTQIPTNLLTSTTNAAGDVTGTFGALSVSKVGGIAPGAANGVATLDGTAHLASAQIPTSVVLQTTDSTSTTNNTIPVVSIPVSSILPIGTNPNVDMALVPSGTGAISAALPDGTATGGNKRGRNSVDLQTARTANTQIASGLYATIAGGYRNTASGNYSFAGGNNSVASIDNAFAFGGGNSATGASSVAIGNLAVAQATYAAALGGNNCYADGVCSTTLGQYAWTRGIAGQLSMGHASSASGKAQHSFNQYFGTTTSTTALRLTTNGSAFGATNQIILSNNTAFRIRIAAVAFDTVALVAKEWTCDLLIRRGANAASTTFVGSPTVTSTFGDSGTSEWSLAVSVDTTNGGLGITATSSTTNLTRWNAVVDIVEAAL